MSNRPKIRTVRLRGSGLAAFWEAAATAADATATVPARREARQADERIAIVETLPADTFEAWAGKSAARKARRLADRTAAGRFA